jgi:hypothetical protein
MKTVNLRHPGYDDNCNILLTLPAIDHPNGGIHAETARLACCIIANNRWDGFLSATRRKPKPAKPEIGVLRGNDYYFHLPNKNHKTDKSGKVIDKRKVKSGPYPITVRFADWTFPAHGLPPIWQAARDANELLAEQSKTITPVNVHGDGIVDNACNLCGVDEETKYSWLWDFHEQRVFARECSKMFVNELLRLSVSNETDEEDEEDEDEEDDDEEEDEEEDEDEDEDVDDDDEENSAKDRDEDEEKGGQVQGSADEVDAEIRGEVTESDDFSSESEHESEEDDEDSKGDSEETDDDEEEAGKDSEDEINPSNQSETADPLDNDLNLIQLGLNCSALPNEFDAGRTFDQYQWLFVPKLSEAGHSIMSAHVFLPRDNDLSTIHDKPLILPWKSSFELHFAHFVQAVFAGLTKYLRVDVDRVIRIMDAEDRMVLIDAQIELVKTLVIQEARSLWIPGTDGSEGEGDASEQSPPSNDQGSNSGDISDSKEQDTEVQATIELKEVPISAERWQQALAELAQDVEDIDVEDTQRKLVPETVSKTVFPYSKCTECQESIYGMMYQSIDGDLTLCSNCKAGFSSQHAETVLIPVYDLPWFEDVPTGKMIPQEDTSSNGANSDEDTNSQKAEESDADNEELTLNEIDGRLSREVSDLTPFAYSDALQDVKPPQIRLFCLEPAPVDEPICGHLETVTLSPEVPFEALSYCWGSMEPECYICIAGCRFRTTPNLKLALYRLRDAVKIRKFWIDAICIDQTNNEEKSHQILLMRDIYFHARQTIVWLGEESERSQTALGMCSRLTSAYGNAYLKQELGVDVEALYNEFLNTQPQQSKASSDADVSTTIKAFSRSFDLDKSLKDFLSHLVASSMTREEEYVGPGKQLVDIALQETAEQIRLEELRVGYITGIDPEDPTYFEKLGTIVGEQFAQGVRWNGPFKEGVEKGIREELGLDEAEWEQYFIDRQNEQDGDDSEAVDGTLAGFFQV